MLEHGYFKNDFDRCVYLKKLLNGSFVYLLYINDMLITSKNMFEINDLKDRLSDEFEIKDLSATKKILVINIHI
jgi:hypothetical protein